MTSFLERWAGKASALATFGDSITEGLTIPEMPARWANRLASRLGARLYNRGISGTVMQSSPAAGGAPRDHNGHGRFYRDLLGAERGDVRDYRAVLAGLIAAGYLPEAIAIGSPSHLPDAGFAVGSDGFAGQSRETYQSFVPLVQALAIEFGCYYAPVNERMAAEGGDALILPDNVHPNAAGHGRIADISAGATRL